MPSLIAGYDFEGSSSVPTGVSAFYTASFSISTAAPHGGTNCLQVATSGGYGGLHFAQATTTTAVPAGTQVSGSFWVKGPSGTSFNWGLYFRGSDSSVNEAGMGSSIAFTGSWQQVTIPAVTHSVLSVSYWAGIEVYVPSGSTTFYIDDVQINAVPFAWLNHVTISGGQNGTNSHQVNSNAGTVLDGVLFAPTAGRLLICIAEGAQTSTTPTGWTLPTNGSSVNNTGLYFWYRVADGTSADNISTAHNGTNYPEVFDYYEYPAGSALHYMFSQFTSSGSTFGFSDGMTGTNTILGMMASRSGETITWSGGGTKRVNASPSASTGTFTYSLAYQDGVTAASALYSFAQSPTYSASCETLMAAITVASGTTSVNATRATTWAVGSSTLATDTFTASNGSAWSSQWTAGSQSGTVDIQSNRGHMQGATGGYAVAPTEYLSGMSAVSDCELTGDVGFNALDESYCYISLRSDGTLASSSNPYPNAGYYLAIFPAQTRYEIGKYIAGAAAGTGVFQDVTFTYTSGTRLSFRFRVVGNVVSCRVWNYGTTEPTSWDYSATDTGTFPAAGKLLIAASNGNTTVANYTFDNIQVTDGSGTTHVTATRATTWAVPTSVTTTRATTWAVPTSVTATRATTWAALAGATTSNASTWAALASVTATRATTWNALRRITQTRLTTWTSRSTITATRATTWATDTSVTATQATTWAVPTSVTATRATMWVVAVTASATRATSWSTTAAITATRSSVWTAEGSAVATRSTTWAVASALTTITTSRLSTWAVAAPVTTTHATAWAVSTATTASRSTTWAVRTVTTVSQASTWSVAAPISTSRATVWNVATATATSRGTTWSVCISTTATRSTTWAVAAPTALRQVTFALTTGTERWAITTSSDRWAVTTTSET